MRVGCEVARRRGRSSPHLSGFAMWRTIRFFNTPDRYRPQTACGRYHPWEPTALHDSGDLATTGPSHDGHAFPLSDPRAIENYTRYFFGMPRKQPFIWQESRTAAAQSGRLPRALKADRRVSSGGCTTDKRLRSSRLFLRPQPPYARGHNEHAIARVRSGRRSARRARRAHRSAV